MVSRYSAYRRGSDTIPPDVIDRILIGACAAIWLVLLGVSVAAAVALADLGSGLSQAAGSSAHHMGAVRRHRRLRADHRRRHPGAVAGSPHGSGRAGRSVGDRAGAVAGQDPVKAGRCHRARARRERARPHTVQAAEPAAEWSGAAVDRVWLRGTVTLTGTMGAALIAVAAATYLMAVGHDGASWVGYVLAGLVTAAMPVVEWLHVRQLRSLIAEH